MGDMEREKMREEFSLEEISKIVDLNEKEIEEFESEGIIDFTNVEKKMLSSKDLEKIKSAAALKKDMGVNAAGIDIILQMKEKLMSLQEEFEKLLEEIKNKN